MKKTIVVLMTLLFATIPGVQAQVSKVLLQHNGNVTMFNGNELAAAITKSVAGDTLYLNDGSFTGGITINKAITIIGAGQNTHIDGSVTIAITGTPTLTAHLLDALYINGDVSVTAAVNGLKIRKCKFANISFTGNVQDMVLDRCFISSVLTLSSYVKGLTAVNSKIYTIKGSGYKADAASFVNCNIYYCYGDYSGSYYSVSPFKGVVINSIVGYSTYTTSTSYRYLCPDAFLVSSLLYDSYLYQYSTCQDCITNNQTGSLNSSTLECSLTTDGLTNKGYLGNDGTVVGIYGGTTPFTLVPSVPTVTESTIKVNVESKQLEVNLKVSAF